MPSIPGLGQKWWFSDGLTFFSDREGPQWSDGEPFTIDDDVYWTFVDVFHSREHGKRETALILIRTISYQG